MDKDTLLTVVAIVASLVGFLNWTTSARKGLVEDLKSQVELLKKEIVERNIERKKLRSRVRFLGKLALQRESENNKLLARMDILNKQVDNIAHMHNQTLLEVFDLRQRLSIATGDPSILGATAPLPPLVEDEPQS